MSLINKMLQELDARRSDSTGAGPFGQQIRAVPERRQLHPAWWVALSLALVVAGGAAWIMLRPVAPVQVASTQLPLKLDPDLNIERPITAPSPDVAGAIAEPAVAVSTDKSAENAVPSVPVVNTVAVEAPAPPPIPAAAVETLTGKPRVKEESRLAKDASETRAIRETKVREAKEVRETKETKPLPVSLAPELAKLVPPARSLAAAPVARPVEASTPVAGNKQVKELTPQQRAENEYRKAIMVLKQGKTGDAIVGLELALQLDMTHTAARQALVGILVEQNRQEDALRWAREGMQLDSSQIGLAMILARLQVEKGELRPAIETLERTLPYAADRADYQAFLAALLQRDGKNRQAAEHYLQALQRLPQNGVWWMGLGICFQAEHRTAEAVEAYKRAKATNSLSPELLAFVDGRLAQLQR